MIRTTLDKAWIRRPIRPIYAMTQATPRAGFLDPAFDRSVDVYPGMVMTRAGGDLFTVPDNIADVPAGLCAQYIGGEGIDELLESGINAMAVWVMGNDAEFEIDSPSFDADATWTDPTDGTELLVHFWATGADRGKLAPAGATKADHTLSTNPVARLAKVNSASTITIAGLEVRA